MSSVMAPELLFLTARDAGWGQRLAVYHRPSGDAVRGKVVYIHPFAEEMNKSRRMAALQSRALARAGYAVLQIDLLGCGDSSGDFADATWDTWIDDVVEACRWLDERHPEPLTLWSLRAGCLLAIRPAQRIDGRVDLVFWQPAVSGAIVLQQFLRLKLAAEIQGGPGKGVVDALRARIAAGETIEVAGYLLSADLATGIETAILEPPSNASRIVWLEVSGRADATLLPMSAAKIGRWSAADFHVDAAVVHGPAFWNSVEIEEAPALIDATLEAMSASAAV